MPDLIKGPLDVLGTLHVHGGGLSEMDGPLRVPFVWFGSYITDPTTTLWGVNEAGRVWYNSTSGKLKFWDGTTVRTITST